MLRNSLLSVAIASLAFNAFAADPIAYVPADTPYVVATFKPMPDAFNARMQESYKMMGDQFGKLVRLSLEQDGQDSESKVSPEDTQAIFDAFSEVGRYFTDDKAYREAGFKPKPKVAFYGVGLVPVLRMEISDNAKVQASVERALQRLVDMDAKKAKSSAKPFRFESKKFRGGQLTTLGGEELQPVILVEGGQLVMSIIPKGAGATALNTLFPAKPAAGNALSKVTAVKNGYRFQDYGVGYLDIMRFADSYMGKPTALERAFAKALKNPIFDTPPSAVCQKEQRSIIANMPRLVFGFDNVDANLIEQRYVLEMKPAIAKEYASITTQMPQYGQGQFAKFAMAFDVMKSAEIGKIQAQRIIDAPYTCESLLELNASAQKMQESMSNPAVGMLAMVKGVGVALDKASMNFSGETPESPNQVAVNAAAFSDQPEMLMAMLGSYAPELAALGLKPGDAPKALPETALAQIPANTLDKNEGFGVMSKNMILVGVGSNRMNSINQALKAPARTQGEFLEFSYGAQAFQLMLDSANQGIEKDAKLDNKEKAEMQNLMKQVFDQMDSVSTTMALTTQGLVVNSSTRYKPLKLK